MITNQFTGIINPNSIVDVWYMLKSESIDWIVRPNDVTIDFR